MAKRFTDSDKWKNPWFSNLSNEAKLTWLYLLDDCDHRGVWQANFKRASFDLGFKIDAQTLDAWFKNKVIKIKSDEYFIKGFISFQYPKGLSNGNNAHKAIILFLKENKINLDVADDYLGPDEDLTRTWSGAQDKDKDKDTATTTVLEKVKENKFFEKFVFEDLGSFDTGLAMLAPKVETAFLTKEGFFSFVDSVMNSKKVKSMSIEERKRYFQSALKSELKDRGVL